MDKLDYIKPGYRQFECANGKTYCAKENSCLFCRHCDSILYDFTNGPYMISCELEISDDVGMCGECLNFEDGEKRGDPDA